MMALPNPTVLSAATSFRPINIRDQSRSPARSRSPVRRSEFIAKELDPILGNLSPDTTLRALESTDTITDGSGHDAALAKSIAEASPKERQLGIKAAVAAQKLREWHTEVAQWHWQTTIDGVEEKVSLLQTTSGRAHGNPFASYGDVGGLDLSTVNLYEDRIEEIYDGLDALDVEDLKNAVLDSRSSFRLSAKMERPDAAYAKDWDQSKIKDFTALVTATIIHMLPDLANLNMLLSTWDVRLTILLHTPQLLENLQSTEQSLQAAAEGLLNSKTALTVTKDEVDATENILAAQVSSLGTQYDQMLDLLEGQQDSLPAEWIDRLEEIENDFAHYVVEARRRVLHNEWVAQQRQLEQAQQVPLPSATPERRRSQRRGVDEWLAEPQSAPRRFPSLAALDDRLETPQTTHPDAPSPPHYESPSRTRDLGTRHEIDQQQSQPDSQPVEPFLFVPTTSQGSSRNTSLRVPSRTTSQRNTPGLTINTPQYGHRREISEISNAESQYSAISGLSDAEIVDARSTQVLASPKIQLVDNPFRASRDDLGDYDHEAQPRVRSMHILGRDAYTRVESHQNHNRAKSLSLDGPPPQYDSAEPDSIPSIPARSGDFSSGMESPTSDTYADSPQGPSNLHRASTASIEMLSRGQVRQISVARPGSRDSTQLLDDHGRRSRSDTIDTISSEEFMAPGTYHRTRPGSQDEAKVRGDHPLDEPSSPSLGRSSDRNGASFLDEPSPSEHDTFASAGERSAADGSLEAKIQSILTTLPTRIRLAREPDEAEPPTHPSSALSTRSSTPAPFTLSPVKVERSSRGAVNDAGVKVYHLRRNGQSNETKPTKLFVRRVGEDGRVMVRVGGGWADLAEYLREYSMHHGNRSMANNRIEVANLPSQSQRQVSDVPSVSSSSADKPRAKAAAVQPVPFDFGTLPTVPKKRQSFVPDFTGPSAEDYAAIARSPEPLHPASSTIQDHTYEQEVSSSTIDHPAAHSDSVHSQITISNDAGAGSGFSTSSPSSSPAASVQKYTPLGAAGPRNGNRRVTTHGTTSSPENARWVDHLMGNVRSVSGGARAGMPPTMSARATTPLGRSSSGNMLNSSPMSVQSNSSHISQTPERVPSLTRDKDLPTARRDGGGVSGIKRVFLRKKSKQ